MTQQEDRKYAGMNLIVPAFLFIEAMWGGHWILTGVVGLWMVFLLLVSILAAVGVYKIYQMCGWAEDILLTIGNKVTAERLVKPGTRYLPYLWWVVLIISTWLLWLHGHTFMAVAYALQACVSLYLIVLGKKLMRMYRQVMQRKSF